MEVMLLSPPSGVAASRRRRGWAVLSPVNCNAAGLALLHTVCLDISHTRLQYIFKGVYRFSKATKMCSTLGNRRTELHETQIKGDGKQDPELCNLYMS
jgi:hypothetical protein